MSSTVDLRSFLPAGHTWSEGATTVIDLAAPPADAVLQIENNDSLAQLASQRHLQNVLIGLYGVQGVQSKTDPPYAICLIGCCDAVCLDARVAHRLWKAIRDSLSRNVDRTSVDMPVSDVYSPAIRQVPCPSWLSFSVAHGVMPYLAGDPNGQHRIQCIGQALPPTARSLDRALDLCSGACGPNSRTP